MGYEHLMVQWGGLIGPLIGLGLTFWYTRKWGK